MFVNSIIAQSQNQKIGSSTVANPNVAVTSGSDCGCGGSTNQGLIASSQNIGDCGCGGHEEDNPPQGLMRFGPAYTGGSGTLIDCYTVAVWERTETIDMPSGGNSSSGINISYQFKGYSQDCYTWNLADETPLDITTGEPLNPIFEEFTPNCPNCLTFKENYAEIKNQIERPGSGMSKNAKVLYDFLIDTFRKMFKNLYDSIKDLNNPNLKDILEKYKSIELTNYYNDSYMKILLQRYLDTIVKDISATEKDTGKCLSVLQVGFDLTSGKFEFKTDNFNDLFGREYLEIDHPKYFPDFKPGTKIYSDFSIAMKKKERLDTKCHDDTYKLYEFKNGSWRLATF